MPRERGRFFPMPSEIRLRLTLVAPPAGVDFGIQRGRGSAYQTDSVQRSTRGDLHFEFTLTVADDRKDGRPNFRGPMAQGPPESRFVYVDVGTLAGQKDTAWSRRMKVPLQGITWTQLRQLRPRGMLSASVAGTGRDGGPSCGTVKLLGDWVVVAQRPALPGARARR